MKMNFNLETVSDYLNADKEVRKEFIKKQYYFNVRKLFDNETCEENIAPNVQRALGLYGEFAQLSYIKDNKGELHKNYNITKLNNGGSIFLQVHGEIKRFNSELVEKYLTINSN